jgi:hypothetical protein
VQHRRSCKLAVPAAVPEGSELALPADVMDIAMGELGPPDLQNDLAVLEACTMVLSTMCSDPALRADFQQVAAHAQVLQQIS